MVVCRVAGDDLVVGIVQSVEYRGTCSKIVLVASVMVRLVLVYITVRS